MTPKEVRRAADQAGRVPAGSQVTRLAAPVSTKIRPEAATAVRARLGAGIRIELADLTPTLAASLRHDAFDSRREDTTCDLAATRSTCRGFKERPLLACKARSFRRWTSPAVARCGICLRQSWLDVAWCRLTSAVVGSWFGSSSRSSPKPGMAM